MNQRLKEAVAAVSFDPKRSNALTMLARIRAAGMLTEDEFFRLSPETRSASELLLGDR
jgi:hypothetical protein